MSKKMSRYVPNKAFGGRKERDGFLCGSTTAGAGGKYSFCVAVKRDENGVHVRDTKDGSDTTLHYSNEEWKRFVQAVKQDEFNI